MLRSSASSSSNLSKILSRRCLRSSLFIVVSRPLMLRFYAACPCFLNAPTRFNFIQILRQWLPCFGIYIETVLPIVALVRYASEFESPRDITFTGDASPRSRRMQRMGRTSTHRTVMTTTPLFHHTQSHVFFYEPV